MMMMMMMMMTMVYLMCVQKPIEAGAQHQND